MSMWKECEGLQEEHRKNAKRTASDSGIWFDLPERRNM